jgi:hypothetical protein
MIPDRSEAEQARLVGGDRNSFTGPIVRRRDIMATYRCPQKETGGGSF